MATHFKNGHSFQITLWCFLLYNKVNQLCVYIYPLPFEPPSHPPCSSSQSTKLSALCYRQLPTSYPFYRWSCIYISATLSHPPLPSLCPHVLSLHLRLYSALQIGSSVPRTTTHFIQYCFLNVVYVSGLLIYIKRHLKVCFANLLLRILGECLIYCIL